MTGRIRYCGRKCANNIVVSDDTFSASEVKSLVCRVQRLYIKPTLGRLQHYLGLK